MLVYSQPTESQTKSPCRPRPQLARLQIPVQNPPVPTRDSDMNAAGAVELEAEQRAMATALSMPPSLAGLPQRDCAGDYPYPALAMSPRERPRRREKPHLSIVTTHSRSFGKGASLRLETLSAISPTVQNTYRNAYERHSRDVIKEEESENDIDDQPTTITTGEFNRKPTLSINTSPPRRRPNRPNLSIHALSPPIHPSTSPFLSPSTTTPISAYVTAPTSPLLSAKSPHPILPSPTHLRIDPAHLAEKFHATALSLTSPSTPTPLSTPSLTSTPSTASTFSTASDHSPYVVAPGLRSILVNSPFRGQKRAGLLVSAPISPEQSPGTQDVVNEGEGTGRKCVTFRTPIEEAVENVVYTLSHFSLYAPEMEVELTVSTESFGGSETQIDSTMGGTTEGEVDAAGDAVPQPISIPHTINTSTAPITRPTLGLNTSTTPTTRPTLALNTSTTQATRPTLALTTSTPSTTRRPLPSLSLNTSTTTPSCPFPPAVQLPLQTSTPNLPSLQPAAPTPAAADTSPPAPSYPTTPVAGRRKRERNWVWTLGRLPGMTAGGEAEPPPTGLSSPEGVLFAGFEGKRDGTEEEGIGKDGGECERGLEVGEIVQGMG
ncbi:hypothetical protein P152DRAFT_452538 [Eremomyces bilateralis CBS 781.70]|uniref:Uncharacterized protein n=1 Tax=Eremomyces bilateralis CBS 781.70 TaxID=1392243 RepID=A0A6G1FSZ6_9PEZI|nr:uncharacterized protein P152DRAFT_452538 [Eremomyces bilateralis CBS 781.70]KAF1808894.1 hypothetical protein P152DRAFT_452538 [Eremomyces bilateralis CBS 781.70]